MNKAQLQKNVGSRVRLRPQATEALGAHDDDWTVRGGEEFTLIDDDVAAGDRAGEEGG